MTARPLDQFRHWAMFVFWVAIGAALAAWALGLEWVR